MLTAEWSIAIPGKPAGKGSLRCIGRRGKQAHVLVEQLAASDPWRKTVAGWITRSRKDIAAVKGQALGVEATFTLPRPLSHYGTGRNAKRLKPSAPKHPTGQNTGDLDKLLRLVADAMQDSDLIHDDAAICEITARKAYPCAEQPDAYDRLPYPGVCIRLYPLDGPDQ